MKFDSWQASAQSVVCSHVLYQEVVGFPCMPCDHLGYSSSRCYDVLALEDLKLSIVGTSCTVGREKAAADCSLGE